MIGQHVWLWLVPMGFVLGALGTLIGAGGGFVLVPVLLLMYPRNSPETITSISLAVVFFNALSGSVAYGKMGRIDFRSGVLFAAATIPGAILGVFTTDSIPRRTFNGVFGVLMVAAAAYLILQRDKGPGHVGSGDAHKTVRRIVEKDGTVHTYSFSLRAGMLWSTLVGYISSLLGIGGGIVHVPVLARLLNFPVHIATATSHFVLAIMALTGTVVHIANGSFAHGGFWRTLYLGIGVLLGAQLGALLSNRVKGVWIIRSLAIALGLVGVRILLMAFES